MFNLGERIKHLDTGNIGIVIGYEKTIVNNKCLEAVKIKLVDSNSHRGKTVKDICSQWFSCPEDYRVLLPSSSVRHSTIKPVTKCNIDRST